MAPIDGLTNLYAAGELQQLAGNPSVFIRTLLELLRDLGVCLPCLLRLLGDAVRTSSYMSHVRHSDMNPELRTCGMVPRVRIVASCEREI